MTSWARLNYEQKYALTLALEVSTSCRRQTLLLFSITDTDPHLIHPGYCVFNQGFSRNHVCDD